MDKPILCVDFDGVIHSYASGWQGADVVSDPPTPGAIEWLYAACLHFRVCIYSSRTSQPGGVRAMQDALARWESEWRAKADAIPRTSLALLQLEFPEQKPAAFLTIDDRAICFDGDWRKLSPQTLLAFKPWNK